jgi:hypothetical protein
LERATAAYQFLIRIQQAHDDFLIPQAAGSRTVFDRNAFGWLSAEQLIG